MFRLPTNVSALALMTIDLSQHMQPAVPPRGRFEHLHLVGYGLVTHRIRPDGKISFMLDTCAIGAGTRESDLADRLEDDLTDVGVLTAYNLQTIVRPLILSVTIPGQHLSLAELASAGPERFCDLTHKRWSNAPVSFADACDRVGIDTLPDDLARDQTLWSFGVTEHLTSILSERAISTFRLWLAAQADLSSAWSVCTDASRQFDAWLEQNPLPVFDRHGRRLPSSKQTPDI